MELFKKMCSCGAIIDGGKSRCRACEAKAQEDRAKYQQVYDKTKRDWTHSFYRSKPWLKTRRIVLYRDNHLCQVCLARGRITHAVAVHHIEELRENYNRRTDVKNLISLCSRHHKIVHDEYDKGKENKKRMQEQLFELIE